MATAIDSISIKGMTKAQLRQLADYIFWADRRGDYYGNKDQFYARHIVLLEFAEFLLALANDKNLRIVK